MLSRIVLLALGLLLAGRVVADDKPLSPPELCRQSIGAARALWLQHKFDASPAVSTLMVNVIDGKLPQVRGQLKTMQPADAVRWRQAAMITAVFAEHSGMADALLDDGAAIDGMGWIPGFRNSFYGQAVEDMKHDSRFGGPGAVKGMEATGLLKNQGQASGPALVIAANCGDLVTVDVLLRHHANAMARQAPNIVDALDTATLQGNVAIVQRLLDHGADSCAHDRRALQLQLKQPARPVATLAQIGRRARLPADLVARLACPAVAFTH